MQGSKQLTLRRLQKEEYQLKNDPIPGVIVKRDGHLNFHFLLHGLDGEYKGGYYHGLLQLHENYPFAAPKLFFYTRNGRFEVNMPICTSFTNYHQETWTSAWNIRSLILGTISFMTCEEGSYGCRNDSVEIRKKYAQESLKQNLGSEKFLQLFRDQLEKMGVQMPQPEPPKPSENIDALSDPINQELIFQQNGGDNEGLNNEDRRRNRNAGTRKKVMIIAGCGIVILLIVLAMR